MNKKVSIGLLLCIVVSILVIWFKSNPEKIEAINFEEVTQADKIEIINQKDTLVIFNKENQWISKNELEISQNQIEKFQNIIQNLQFKSYPTKNFYQNLQQKSSIIANIYQKNQLMYSLAIAGSSLDGFSLYVQTLYPNSSDTILAYVIGNQDKLINFFNSNELEWTDKKVFPLKKSDLKSIAIAYPNSVNNFYINCLDKKITVNDNNYPVNESKLNVYMQTFSTVHFLSSIPCDKKSDQKLFSITLNGYLQYEGFAIEENGILNRNFYVLQHQKNCFLMRYVDTDPLLIKSDYLTQ